MIQVDSGAASGQVDTGAIVRPGTKLQFPELVVEREPADVDGTGGDVETEWNLGTRFVRVDDDVRIRHCCLYRMGSHLYSAIGAVIVIVIANVYSAA